LKSALGSNCSFSVLVDEPKMNVENNKYNPKTLIKIFIA
jgi:hypothetical protein